MTTPNTMRVWDAVSKTNPANTKRVNQRGGFTSICAQSQIMEATRQFGPIGEGWGYTASAPMFHDNLVLVQVALWHGDRANVFGPITGGAEWKSDKGRVDSDAPKKATTDALTKLLSQLGFNADVFLGLYDDNKYVRQMEQEFAGKRDDAPAAPRPATITADQLTELQLLLDQLGVPVAQFLQVGNISALNELAATEFETAKRWINKRAREMQGAKQEAA
jgi:hypothetical protein